MDSRYAVSYVYKKKKKKKKKKKNMHKMKLAGKVELVGNLW